MAKVKALSKARGLSTVPAYAEAEAALEAAKVRRAVVVERLEALTKKRAQIMATRDDSLEAEAEDLLAGRGTGETPSSMKELNQQIQAEGERLAVVDRAIQIGTERLDSARFTAGAEIASELRPAYAALLQRIADALVDLAHLTDEEERFRDELLAKGIRPDHLRPLPPRWLNLQEEQGPGVNWLREAHAKHGVKVSPDLPRPGSLARWPSRKAG